jgi:riboflavin kinase, archaea type
MDPFDLLPSIPNDFVGEKEWFFLFWIAYYNLEKKSPISTPDLCKLIPLSQQTISRRIIEMEKIGLIKRNFQSRGGELDLTSKGYTQLQTIFKNLKSIFLHDKCIDEVNGLVKKGMGEGGYYIQHPNYLAQFKKKLGFVPYYGTLNVQLEPMDFKQIEREIAEYEYKVIEGFKDEGRTYGNVNCYIVDLWPKNRKNDKVVAALLKIQRTSHKPFVLEFICEKFLREYFDLVDDDEIFFQFKK